MYHMQLLDPYHMNCGGTGLLHTEGYDVMLYAVNYAPPPPAPDNKDVGFSFPRQTSRSLALCRMSRTL